MTNYLQEFKWTDALELAGLLYLNDGKRRCNEIGVMLRYAKKVAENPIYEVHKKAGASQPRLIQEKMENQ